MIVEDLQENLQNNNRAFEQQTRKQADTIEKLKKERRRMDELITLKEGRIEKLEQ